MESPVETSFDERLMQASAQFAKFLVSPLHYIRTEQPAQSAPAGLEGKVAVLQFISLPGKAKLGGALTPWEQMERFQLFIDTEGNRLMGMRRLLEPANAEPESVDDHTGYGIVDASIFQGSSMLRFVSTLWKGNLPGQMKAKDFRATVFPDLSDLSVEKLEALLKGYSHVSPNYEVFTLRNPNEVVVWHHDAHFYPEVPVSIEERGFLLEAFIEDYDREIRLTGGKISYHNDSHEIRRFDLFHTADNRLAHQEGELGYKVRTLGNGLVEVARSHPGDVEERIITIASLSKSDEAMLAKMLLSHIDWLQLPRTTLSPAELGKPGRKFLEYVPKMERMANYIK